MKLIEFTVASSLEWI